MQFFPGQLYLERVVADALRLLAPGGALLLADVLDPRRDAELDQALAAAGAPPRRGEKAQRFDEDLFRDFGAALPAAGTVEVLHRTAGFANELSYRYDVLIHKAETPDAGRLADQGLRARRKRLWTGWHVMQRPAARPAAVASPEDIAYVIHTSGSTGAPKGIAVQHAPAANLIGWINETFRVGPGDRLLLVASLCFDLSVYDIFGVLGAGGAVQVAPEAAMRDAEWLVRLLREQPVTIWDSAPAALQQLVPLFPPASEDRPLRLVMLSGDWIPVRLPDQVRAAFPRAQVMALGGATEATIWSNWFPVGEVGPEWPSIPYGRPITKARYHVLDEGMLPCPIGVPGDLYIGGQVLCLGYAGQPGLTAAQFVPDPFTEEPGERLYRTGDRARFFPDGNLEFLGRVDQQVKVRGYRIELGEIELVLLRHPEVRTAVVTVREDRPGDRLLVAYVVPREGRTPDVQELRAFLGDKLPAYMLPSAFVTLKALPVTANGKLDRKALPPPDRSASEETYAAPTNPVEELLTVFWCEVLGLDRVGIHDDFFALGGHSLLATRVVSRIRNMFGVELPLRTLFEAPTIAGVAQALKGGLQKGAAPAPPIGPAPREGYLPLSFAQQRLWIIDELEPGNPAYNVGAAVRLTGEVAPDLLARIFTEVARRHEVLRTTFTYSAGAPAQVVGPEPRLDLPVVNLTYLPEAEWEAKAAELAREELRRPFDLRRGPLLRLSLLRFAEDEQVLLVTMHHIATDGWSMGILMREIGALYEAFSQGSPSPLPELPVQYADFAVWQRRWLQGEALESQLAYWRSQLAGAPRLLELPTDRPRPAVPSHAGASRPVALPPSLSESLLQLCRRDGATPFMALLTAWAVLLGRHTGQDDVLVGTPIAGRNRREIEELIGFFVNTLVIRADLSGAPGFGQVLGRVRRAALDAYMHQDLPFERLVEELVAERDFAVSPLFQALFAFQSATGPGLSVPGLVLTPLALESGLAKFNLTLTFWEGNDHTFEGALRYKTDLFDAS
ncbi:MAG TPA: amino acid adenylation domain-containing protein, partial [Thermoanaerobaculia bacterium]|nr:amino acid adenylation domain-containing protein [Thermoanaerobaculia bacterium]